jgi:hypothetical protein
MPGIRVEKLTASMVISRFLSSFYEIIPQR